MLDQLPLSHEESKGAPEAIPVLALSTIAVVVGLGDWPYGFYILLRLMLCGVSAFLLIGSRLRLATWEQWVLGAFVVLYNPVIPVRLGEKPIWIALNLITVGLFWFIRARRGAAPEWVQRRKAKRASELQARKQRWLAAEHERQRAAERERQIADARVRLQANSSRLERWQEKMRQK